MVPDPLPNASQHLSSQSQPWDPCSGVVRPGHPAQDGAALLSQGHAAGQQGGLSGGGQGELESRGPASPCSEERLQGPGPVLGAGHSGHTALRPTGRAELHPPWEEGSVHSQWGRGQDPTAVQCGPAGQSLPWPSLLHDPALCSACPLIPALHRAVAGPSSPVPATLQPHWTLAARPHVHPAPRPSNPDSWTNPFLLRVGEAADPTFVHWSQPGTDSHLEQPDPPGPHVQGLQKALAFRVGGGSGRSGCNPQPPSSGLPLERAPPSPAHLSPCSLHPAPMASGLRVPPTCR